jgi:glycosyltransferase involved in cell wall biosynthesis
MEHGVMRADKQPLVSIVTPAYNEEKYIRGCIESVMSQTYENWEYSIINNCSTDLTLEIAKEYCVRDERVRVYDNEDFVSGVQNHNIALSKASPKSKYCKVVGADDWIYADCLARMVEAAEANPTAGIVGAFWIYSELDTDMRVPAPVGGGPGTTLVPGRDMCRLFLMGGPYQFGSPTSLLYRSDLVRDCPNFFDDGVEYADLAACLEVLDRCDFAFVPQILTFTRTRRESLYGKAKARGEQYYRTLGCLKRYGSKYLSDDEIETRTTQSLSAYYEFLGSCFYDRRGREFWDFHRKNMHELTGEFCRPRLMSNAAVYAIEVMGRRLRKAISGSR